MVIGWLETWVEDPLLSVAVTVMVKDPVAL